MNKADRDAPAAPTALSRSATSITLNEIPDGEYRMNNGDWQAIPVFTGL